MKKLADIIAFAVENEVEAYEFYKGVAETTQDDNLKQIFQELAEEEKNHQMLLEGFLAPDAEPLVFKETADYQVAETVDKPKLSLEMKPVDAVALAMKLEQEAMEMYQKLADESASDSQRDMFLNLVAMEQGHKTKLENLYTNMAFPEVW